MASSGLPIPIIRIQSRPFDTTSEERELLEGRTDIGATVAFTGWCRDEGESLSALELEHYPGMAEAEIRKHAVGAIARFDLGGLLAIHRYGTIAPGEPIVLVIAAARHRQAAFDGANYLMDYLKTRAPFWKKERRVDGSEGGWVAAKDEDDGALAKWSEPVS